MKRNFPYFFKLSTINILLAVIYIGLFVYLLLQPPIYSPDTSSYVYTYIYRSPGYSVFLWALQVVFGEFFDILAVAIQLVFGFVAINILASKIRAVLKMNLLSYLLLLGILTFPYFAPLWIGNNVCSEGLAYPLFLFLVVYIFDFLFIEKNSKILYLSIVLVFLTLTRGQFIILIPIVIFLYILKERKNILRRPKIFHLLVLLILPFIIQTLDRTYHKIVHDIYVSTPFTFVNAITLPFFVSKEKDIEKIKDADQRALFFITYHDIDSLGLLSSKIEGNSKAEYETFYKYFPTICNAIYHKKGMAYFADRSRLPNMKAVWPEEAAKGMMPALIKNNFEKYIILLFEGIFKGFYGIVPFLIAFLLFLYSLTKTIRKWSVENGVILTGTVFIVSNAFLVAFAAIPILRYMIYNYFFVLLIVIILFRKLKRKT
ncbi:MAG: hypothetical protein Q8O62_13905 [Aequorivita sp.]|nr:hypothetical protein [Aequorivita sp.]